MMRHAWLGRRMLINRGLRLGDLYEKVGSSSEKMTYHAIFDFFCIIAIDSELPHGLPLCCLLGLIVRWRCRSRVRSL